MSFGIGAAAIKLRLVAVDGIGDPARRISQEINRHGARPAANVPKNSARERRQLGKSACPRIALCQLAVIVETAVWRGKAMRHRPGIGAFNADNVEIRNAVMRPAIRRPVNP